MSEKITMDNYLWHLDELTDEQITDFLSHDPVYKHNWEVNRHDLETTPKEEWSAAGLYTTRTDRMLANWLRCMG